MQEEALVAIGVAIDAVIVRASGGVLGVNGAWRTKSVVVVVVVAAAAAAAGAGAGAAVAAAAAAGAVAAIWLLVLLLLSPPPSVVTFIIATQTLCSSNRMTDRLTSKNRQSKHKAVP